MPASKDSLHGRLRAATRSLHDELEGAVEIERRVRTRQGYVNHLVQLWRLHVAAENALRRLNFEPLGFVYPSPHRARLLETDLAFFGVGEEELARLRLAKAPSLQTIAEGLGCMYVVEGSAKGARAILPKIREVLGLTSGEGASFFAGTRDTVPLWHAVLAAIDRFPPWSREGDEAVSAAIDTFAMFREGLVRFETGISARPASGAAERSQRHPIAS